MVLEEQLARTGHTRLYRIKRRRGKARIGSAKLEAVRSTCERLAAFWGAVSATHDENRRVELLTRYGSSMTQDMEQFASNSRRGWTCEAEWAQMSPAASANTVADWKLQASAWDTRPATVPTNTARRLYGACEPQGAHRATEIVQPGGGGLRRPETGIHRRPTWG